MPKTNKRADSRPQNTVNEQEKNRKPSGNIDVLSSEKRKLNGQYVYGELCNLITY